MITKNRLKEKLLEFNITGRKLAELTGISENSIYQYIMGTRSPRKPIADKIASILNTTPDQIFLSPIPKCKTCNMPAEIKKQNTTIRNNTGNCTFCYMTLENIERKQKDDRYYK